ncbi:MAG: glutathione S-transferase [Marivita sp.]|uniref:glutathione S-transferase n=1 Tax=Marivita sp. TaxID=2003365 RepID=UPI003EF64CB1
MTYELFIGDYTYSSWSLRGWLLFRKLGLTSQIHLVAFDKASVADQLPQIAPARTVPAMRTPEGTVVWESLAMAEDLHDRHPDGGLWPTDPAARSLGRALAAEMHAGFTALRGECPMNLRTAYHNVPLSDATRADIARIETIWSHARTKYADQGPWLLGSYSIADIAFAPVAARFAGYDVALSNMAQAYVDAHLSDTMFRQWRTMALVTGNTLQRYAKPFDTKPWPGPKPRAATPVDTGPAVNATCPFTGGTPAYFLDLNGTIYGFENKLCRDETAHDPDAWPAFMAMAKDL